MKLYEFIVINHIRGAEIFHSHYKSVVKILLEYLRERFQLQVIIFRIGRLLIWIIRLKSNLEPKRITEFCMSR